MLRNVRQLGLALVVAVVAALAIPAAPAEACGRAYCGHASYRGCDHSYYHTSCGSCRGGCGHYTVRRVYLWPFWPFGYHRHHYHGHCY